uniref:deoxyuridine 5'-triphosphate nucleotidohydrolase n=1 Tax=Erigeron canadensis TaxID=72917 RepID=UPI001CB93FD1|nr:deoxyuridine 5'-triphosphate nucleotidohydrolase [Erigeron canadensis]
MAGTVGAITGSVYLAGNSSPYKPTHSLHLHFQHSQIINCSSSKPFIPTMAQNITTTTTTPEIMEPIAKIQKLDPQNDNSTSLFRVQKLSDNAVLPTRGSSLAAGYDLSSAIKTKVPARGKALVATDLSIAVPEGTYARIAPRSGLAWKHSIDVGAGVIDADYRGPVGVILFNHSDVDFEVKAGDRIAQLIIEKIITPDVVQVDDLDSTIRGAGGFGSTGV